MQDQLSMAVEKVENVLLQNGSITFSNLEALVDVSYNLLFLSIDRLSSEHKIGSEKMNPTISSSANIKL